MRRRCPECGQPVKAENLAAHLGRVHPRVSRSKYGDLHVPKPRGARRGIAAWLPLAAIVMAVLVAAGVYFVIVQRGLGSGSGKFYADHTFYDLGSVSQTVSQHTFTFQNRGEGALSLDGVWTSCGCTTAHIVIGAQQSPHFGMHDNPPWSGKLAPGATATLVVLYDAAAMPDLYVGDRSIFVKTSDPGDPEPEFVIRVSEG